jgi:hypothetical protein
MPGDEPSPRDTARPAAYFVAGVACSPRGRDADFRGGEDLDVLEPLMTLVGCCVGWRNVVKRLQQPLMG